MTTLFGDLLQEAAVRPVTSINYTVSQIKRGHFSFRHNFYSC